MDNLVIGTIRTTVPSIVTSFILFLGARGFELDEAAAAGLEAFMIGFAVSIYYVIIRVLGHRFPWVEAFLGSKKTPEYDE